MTKRILAVLLCIVWATALTACGSSQQQPPVSNPSASQQPLPSTVTFSDAPTVYFFGDEHLSADYLNNGADYFLGSSIATYMSAYLHQALADKPFTVKNHGVNGGDLKSIASSVSKKLTSSIDLAVLLLSDRDAKAQTDAAEYKQTLDGILAQMKEKAKHILVIGPFTDSTAADFKQSFAAYRQAAKQACDAVSAVQYFDCQPWIEGWAADGAVCAQVNGYTILSANTQMKLAAEILRATRMTSLNTRTKAEVTKSFTSEYVLCFAGDSLTDAGRGQVIEKGMDLGDGFVSFVNAYLLAEYGDKAPTVYNGGRSGATAASMRGTFRTDVDNQKPNCLVMMVGINDAYTQWTSESDALCSPEKYKSTLDRVMHDYAQEYEKVLLIAPYYLEDPALTDTKRAVYVQPYMDAAREIAAQYSNTVFLDVQSAFDAQMAEIGYGNLIRLSPDKCHLSTEGHRILMNEILKALQI